MTFKKINKSLKADGWEVVFTYGSLYLYRKVGVDFSIAVPFHPGKDIASEVLDNLEKQTGLSLRR